MTDVKYVGAQSVADSNQADDPYPLTIVQEGFFRRIATVLSRAFSTSIFNHSTSVSEAEALKSFGYGGLAVRYLCWRSSVMMMGAIFLCYSLGDDFYTKIVDIMSRHHHNGKNDLYKKIFHDQLLTASIADGVYALSLLLALLFWLYAMYTWKNFNKSMRAMRTGYVISFIVPFLIMLIFPFRDGVDLTELAKDSCQSVINGRVPDVLDQMMQSGNHATADGAEKAARLENKPEIKPKFFSHIPDVNVSSLFHRLHVEIPDTICEFDDPHWSANIKQRLINAGFVRDENTNTCPAAVHAMKMMHIVPQNYNPKFRNLLETTEDDNSAVFSLDNSKNLTKAQCKPCEACVDLKCRKHTLSLLGKHFSLSPVLKKSLHVVAAAKKSLHEFQKSHEIELEAADHALNQNFKKYAEDFEKEMEKANPKFQEVIEQGKKALKIIATEGLVALHRYDAKLASEYENNKKAQHAALIKLQKEAAVKVERARRHGNHAFKEAKAKYAKKFDEAKKEVTKSLSKAHKKMVWKIKVAKTKYLAKQASVAARLAAARHARMVQAKGGDKVMQKYKLRLFAKLDATEKKYKAKFDTRKFKILADLKAKKAKYAKKLAAHHSSKKYIAKLQKYVHKIDIAKAKALEKLAKHEAIFTHRIARARASAKFFASKKDISNLLSTIKTRVRTNIDQVKHSLADMLSLHSDGAHYLEEVLKKDKDAYNAKFSEYKADYVKAKELAKSVFHRIHEAEHETLEKFKKEFKKGLAEAKKLGPDTYKKAEAEAKKKLAEMTKEVHTKLATERDHMKSEIDKHFSAFDKLTKALKANFSVNKAKINKEHKFMAALAKHTEEAKKKYEKNKEKYKKAFHEVETKLHKELAHLNKTLTGKKLTVSLKAVEEKIKQARDLMKNKIAKGKAVLKAHKAQLKHEVHKLAHEAHALGQKVPHGAKEVNPHGAIEVEHAKVAVLSANRKLLANTDAETDDFLADDAVLNAELAAQQISDDGEERHVFIQTETPEKCAACHLSCYANCVVQYFGPLLLENTISSSMCMGSNSVDSLDTVKTAMDAVSHLDYLLGSQQGLQAFVLLLPASLSFLGAVLKGSKLAKKALPQSRLAGYLIVLAAISNIPIMAAFIAMGYQAVGDVFFCLGMFSFLSTFLVFCVRIENLVKSQTHAEADQTIDRRGQYTYIGFAGAGIFLGVFVWEHQVIVRAALHLPLTMLVIKKVCDFLGRSMFSFVFIVDLTFSLFHKLYGNEIGGDKLEGQGFEQPLGQLKSLFVNRDSLAP